MENVETKISKSSIPHSFSTPPFARNTLSGGASTSLLHRPRAIGTLRSLNGNMPNLDPVNISSMPSRQKISSSNNFLNGVDGADETKRSRDQSVGPKPSESLLSALKGQPLDSSIEKSSTEESTAFLPAPQIKDEKQAKKNDMILQERLMEAKSMNNKSASGATVHKFSLWSGVKPQVQSQSPLAPTDGMINSHHSKEPQGMSSISHASVTSTADNQLYKSTKLRGHKQAIEMQGTYDMSLLSAKLASIDSNETSKYSTPQRSVSDRDQYNETRSSQEKLKSGRVTSSLRSKIDNAVALASDDGLSQGKEHSQIQSRQQSKKSGYADHRYKDQEFSNRDDENQYFTDASDIEEIKQVSRPSSEPLPIEEKVVGRPPLPGIKHQASFDSNQKKSNRSRNNSQSLPDDKVPSIFNSQHGSNPSPISGMGASSFDSDSEISPSVSSGVSPPPVTKSKAMKIQNDSNGGSNASSRDFSSAPDSPLSTSPKVSEPVFQFAPKLAFRSRTSSVNNSVNGSLTNSSNNSASNSLNNSLNLSINSSFTKLTKEESLNQGSAYSFLPVKDAVSSAPESRSHSIFHPNGKEFASNLSLNLQTIEGYHLDNISASGGIVKYSESNRRQSPDYGREPLDTPSPTLSVMTHMSEDAQDKHDQLFYSYSNEVSPRGDTDSNLLSTKQTGQKSNPFGKPVANPFVSNQNPTNKLGFHHTESANGTTLFGYRRGNDVKDSKLNADQSSMAQFLSDPMNPNILKTINDDDHSGYSEVTYTGADGENTLRWQRGNPIGEGSYGRVYKGMNEKTGELAAVKQLGIGNGSDADIDQIRREIRVMWQLDHENIVRYIGAARSTRYLFIILEFVSGGSIANMLQQFGAFSESLIRSMSSVTLDNELIIWNHRKFSFHIICGVEYLHNKGIIHRDIKGANVLVTDTGVAKIADFGCSKQLAGLCTTSLEESLKAIRGSVPWMAPEMIKQAGHGRSSDIWSVGATVIEMATGKPPWSEFTNNLAALFHVATSKEPPPIPSHLSRSCAAFLKKCMMVEPSTRATASELLTQDDFLLSEIEQQHRRSRSSSLAVS